MKMIVGMKDWMRLGRSFWELVLILMFVNALGLTIFAASGPLGLVIWFALCGSCCLAMCLYYDEGLVLAYGLAVASLCLRQFLVRSRPYDSSFELMTALSLCVWLMVMIYSAGKFADDNRVNKIQAVAAIFKTFLALVWVTKI